MTMKQVTKQEYDTLKKLGFHTEVRSEPQYFAQIVTKVGRPKGAKNKPKAGSAQAGNGVSAAELTVRGTPRKRRYFPRGTMNCLLALTPKYGHTRFGALRGSNRQKVYDAIGSAFNQNHFTQYPRDVLSNKVKEKTGLAQNQIQPVISELIGNKVLKKIPIVPTAPAQPSADAGSVTTASN